MSRWLLLFAVAFGVVAMHHVPASAGADPVPVPVTQASQAVHLAGPEVTGAVHEDQQPGPHGSHDVMHECLAVLAQAGLVLIGLVLLLGLVRAAPQTCARNAGYRVRAPDPPPGTGGRAILTSVCVLRV